MRAATLNTQMSHRLIYTLVVILLLLVEWAFSIDLGCDPLYVPKGSGPDMIDLTVRDNRTGMSGHSFGAVMTQAVSGDGPGSVLEKKDRWQRK